MKKIISLRILLFSSILLLNSKATFAQFNSKGPFGGSVSCSIAVDTSVYVGTLNGGVFQSTTSQLLAWRPLVVGLKSGKITALTYSGLDLFAATADSGIYVYNGYVGTNRYWVKINNGLNNLKIKSLLALDSTTILAGTDGGGSAQPLAHPACSGK